VDSSVKPQFSLSFLQIFLKVYIS